MKTESLNQLLDSATYKLASLKDQILFETYVLIGENVDLQNTYMYSNLGKSIWTFEDREGFKHTLKLNYNPGVANKELTVKIFWEKDGKPSYDKPPATDSKVFNTHLKILIDEILPKLPDLLKHFDIDKLTVDATDNVRFRLYSIALTSLLDKDKFELIKVPESNILHIRLK
jgi:hypothetical protein